MISTDEIFDLMRDINRAMYPRYVSPDGCTCVGGNQMAGHEPNCPTRQATSPALNKPLRSMDEVIAEWREKLRCNGDPAARKWLRRKIADLEAQRDAANV